jgi:predicted nucleic acid-binding Zn ribbon protein
LEIEQKKYSNTVNFSFTDDSLRYSIKDAQGKRTFSVEYGEIPQEDYDEFIEQNGWFRNVGILWMLLGGFIVVNNLVQNGTSTISLWLILGALCLGVYIFTKVTFTVINTNSGSIFLICDDKKKLILDEIDKRRKKQWLQWYGTVNHENDLDSEIEKFKWLLEKGVVDLNEYNSLIKQIPNYDHNKDTSKKLN